MKILIAVLVIFPWSLLFGLAYLVYRRVRGQQVGMNMGPIEVTGPSTWSKADAPVQECEDHLQDLKDIAEGTAVVAGTPPNTYLLRTDVPTYETYQEMKDGWKVVDADHITKIGRA